MKIYHVSSAAIQGGAARAGLRLHRGLCQMDGAESLWLDAGGLPDPPNVRQLNAGTAAPLLTRVRRTQWRNKMRTQFNGCQTPYSNPFGWGNPGAFQDIPVPEVWNLHWVSNFLDWENLLPWMAEKAPVVWTLHDLNPLMGVWHYVPMASELDAERKRLEEKAIAVKKQALSRIPKDRLKFVGPSKWMVEECRQSPVTQGFPAVHIPYGLDTTVFSPKDRRIVRSMFSIPDDVKVLGFVADGVGDPRKGIQQLEAAIMSLPASHRVHVLTVGSGRSPEFKFPHSHFGSIQNDHILSFFYSACDLFACPSLQDNLPNTVLEAMACGTPVVAYKTGGLPDMVRDGKSGKIVNAVGDSLALAEAISTLLAAPEQLQAMGHSARSIVEAEYALGIQSQRYADLYRQKNA